MAKKMGGIVKLKLVMGKLQRSLSGKKSAPGFYIPGDVKKGHFVVIAARKDELRRFVIPLAYLAQPEFLRLLENAAEEYGFDHKGAVTVPCRPSYLEELLKEHNANKRHSGVERVNRSSYKNVMIRSC